ncbi:MAG: TerB family tellurite resistance protein [Myxococcota bacterium]|nr:TerB family tellurite resistance protein [Myxococcota bacterium]MDW8361005.1 TerB family tellurite resistance protein [Myxococcales bacterium]
MATRSERLLALTDLLLGAAHADGTRTGAEERTVRRLLGQLVGAEGLPAEVDARLRSFSPQGFDVVRAAAPFASDPRERRRKLLELVAAVRDADDEIDLAEDDYLRQVARAVGLEQADWADLALDYQVEELRDAFESLRG